VPVSFDGNWRGKLWARWDGDARTILGRIVEHADILFGNHRDVALLLGREAFEECDGSRDQTAANLAFEAFPKLRAIASTQRDFTSSGGQRLSARLFRRTGRASDASIDIHDVVDRIGSGDAFVAGVIDGLSTGAEDAAALRDGLALAALKHSLPGDASLFSRADIEAVLAGVRDVRR